MQKITIISVGKVKTSWINEGIELYRSRLRSDIKLEERVLEAGNEKEEHAKILKTIESSHDVIVVLDEQGKEMSSKGFSAFLSQKKDEGSSMTFVIGGAYGLSDEIRKKADVVMGFGPMTFPHEMAQLMLFEQLFRAIAIRKGTGYHHE